jgi:hypothetical protein
LILNGFIVQGRAKKAPKYTLLAPYWPQLSIRGPQTRHVEQGKENGHPRVAA